MKQIPKVTKRNRRVTFKPKIAKGMRRRRITAFPKKTKLQYSDRHEAKKEKLTKENKYFR